MCLKVFLLIKHHVDSHRICYEEQSTRTVSRNCFIYAPAPGFYSPRFLDVAVRKHFTYAVYIIFSYIACVAVWSGEMPPDDAQKAHSPHSSVIGC